MTVIAPIVNVRPADTGRRAWRAHRRQRLRHRPALYAHIVRKRQGSRNVARAPEGQVREAPRPQAAVLETRRSATYTVQFDTYRRYESDRDVKFPVRRARRRSRSAGRARARPRGGARGGAPRAPASRRSARRRRRAGSGRAARAGPRAAAPRSPSVSTSRSKRNSTRRCQRSSELAAGRASRSASLRRVPAESSSPQRDRPSSPSA